MDARRGRHETIKYELRMKGTSFAELGRRHAVHPSVFSAVASGRRRSLPTAKIIADALGTDPSILWPELYGDTDG
ncbi:helix-turn-helix domain-containing protein [Paenirhodobacter populi]|uniref:DNA-binding protein n=1 Tax=Paenirhodobacter populi TaxID=2306993 RepID=A0A443J9Z2_9RHOB|nr:DNA-binding protein [Sinirhodobacter populi]